jgi:hypothetical protein
MVESGRLGVGVHNLAIASLARTVRVSAPHMLMN